MKEDILNIIKEILNTIQNWEPEQKDDILGRISAIQKDQEKIKEFQDSVNDEIKQLKIDIMSYGEKSKSIPLFKKEIKN